MHAVHTLFEAHLPVADLDASVAFYRDRIGLDVAYVLPGQAAFLWIGDRGRAMLGLWSAGPGPQKMTLHVAFGSTLSEVLAAPRTLRAAGITALDFDSHPTDEAVVLGWMPAVAVYFRDPDGHLLEYIAMLPDEPRPEAGVMTWKAWRADAANRATSTRP
jgi:lactoylglutathione lyase